MQSVVFIHTKFDKQHILYKYTTRTIRNNKIKQNFYKKISCQRFIAYLDPKYYNILPVNIRPIIDVKPFIKKVKQYLSINKSTFLKIRIYCKIICIDQSVFLESTYQSL